MGQAAAAAVAAVADAACPMLQVANSHRDYLQSNKRSAVAAAARCAFINVITLLERCGPFNKKQQFTARNTRQYKWTVEQPTLLDFLFDLGAGDWDLGLGMGIL